jgi:FkbM family methyltransferase
MKHFFDIGAHVGQVFSWLPKHPEYDGCHVWCFEPSPRHLTELRRRCFNEGARRWTVTLCPFALSDRTGWTKLYEKQDHFGDSLFSGLYFKTDYVPNSTTSPDIVCPVIDVIAFMFENVDSGDRVTIKLDAEGSEYDILERILFSPAAIERVERIFVEFHGLGSPTKLDDRREYLIARIRSLHIALESWTI